MAHLCHESHTDLTWHAASSLYFHNNGFHKLVSTAEVLPAWNLRTFLGFEDLLREDLWKFYMYSCLTCLPVAMVSMHSGQAL